MATGGGREMIKGLQEEVTCPLCLGIFIDPKRLPCEHVYCRECLHGLALRSIADSSITCPVCRRDHPVPNNDVTTFPTPLRLTNIIEMYQRAVMEANEAGEVDGPPPTNNPSCGVHQSQLLTMYCETCEGLTCPFCALSTCVKEEHVCGFINEMVEKQRAELEKDMQPIEKFHQEMSSALGAISAAREEMLEEKREKLHKIQSTYDQCIEFLKQERERHTETIKEAYQRQESLNSSKKDEVSEALKEVESLIDNNRSSQDTNFDFLARVKATKQLIKNAVTKFQALTLLPDTNPKMEIELLEPADLKDFCQTRNFTYQEGDLFRSHLVTSVNFHDMPFLEASEVAVILSPTDRAKKDIFGRYSHSVTANLHCLDRSSTFPVSVKKITPEKYALAISPRSRGHHELFITCNDAPICGSPIQVFVNIRPHQVIMPEIVDAGGIGVKYYKGKLFLVGLRNDIIVYDPSTKSLSRKTNFPPALGEILVDGDHIYGTILPSNKVVKMRMNGSVVKSIGGEGGIPGKFRFPNGIQLSKDGEIYVCDTRNHRVQVFDRNLKFIRLLGRMGHGKGCLLSPCDLAFDEVGNLYIAEQGNYCIQVLSPQGDHIRYIGGGILSGPVSPAIYQNMVFVTVSDFKIAVFKLSGEFVTFFGGDYLEAPECMTIDDNGFIYVTDRRTRLTIFHVLSHHLLRSN